MTDFLDHILSRSFGEIAAVKPRMGARFEAQGGTILPSDALMPADSKSPPAEVRPPAKGMALIDDEPTMAPSPTETAIPRLHPRDDDRRPAATQLPSVRLQTLIRQDSPAIHTETPSQPPVSTSSGEPAETERFTMLVSPAPRVETQPEMQHPMPERMAESSTSFISHAVILEATPLLEARAETMHTPAPQTTVRVSIERIEVGLPPPAPPRPVVSKPVRAPLKPVRSLDDYLRQQTRGKR
jgi:hypothetical protein